MKRFILLFVSFCIGMAFLCEAAVATGSEATFVNNQTEEFTAFAGQIVTRTGVIRFADAEIPPDPSTPVIMSNGIVFPEIDINIVSDDYSFTMEGDACFTARIVDKSYTSNMCTVLVTYAPRELGTHTAKLRVYCANAGVPLVTIPLKGEATAVLGDMDDNGLLTIGDVTGMVDQLLKGTCDTRADMNNDGKVSIGDVTVLINCLLGGE